MSPTQFHEQQQAKRESGICPAPLKINKDSHMIKKSSSSPQSSSSSNGIGAKTTMTTTTTTTTTIRPQQQQRHPVIIYTHSPKIIHTHPRDFMALVQKLTGLSRSDNDHDHNVAQAKVETCNELCEDDNKSLKGVVTDDNEASSVITDENCGSVGDGQVNSCFLPPVFDQPNPFFSNVPLFTPSSSDFLCSNQPFYNYNDSWFFNTPNMRNSISSSTLEAMNEFHEY